MILIGIYFGILFIIIPGIIGYMQTYEENNVIEQMSKELKIWIIIGYVLLLINVIFFIPTDGFGDYKTIGDYYEYDIDVQCFIIQTIGIIFICTIGYIIHSHYYNYNPYIQNKNSYNTINEEKKEAQNDIPSNNINNSYNNYKVNNKFALSSLICGILSIWVFALPLGLTAIILGIMGFNTFDLANEKNESFALIGIIIGLVASIIGIINIMYYA